MSELPRLKGDPASFYRWKQKELGDFRRINKKLAMFANDFRKNKISHNFVKIHEISLSARVLADR